MAESNIGEKRECGNSRKGPPEYSSILHDPSPLPEQDRFIGLPNWVLSAGDLMQGLGFAKMQCTVR
jgi:hypothetical protein